MEDPAASDPAVPDPAASASARARDGAAAAVERAVRAVAARAPGGLSVAVADLSTGVSAGYGATGRTFVTASIAKADILAALLLRTEDAGRGLSAEERERAAAMIRRSDNGAADALYTAVGLADGLDRANRTLGLTATTAGGDRRWGLTATTAADQLALLRAVFDGGSPLGAASRAHLGGLMGQVEAGQDWGVSAAADPGTGPRLKNGWLPRSATGLWVVNSIGLVRHDGRPLLVAVLSDGSPALADGISLVESAAVAAADALTGALAGGVAGGLTGGPEVRA
ncbi:class A beta-lactamase-related serine hydrolase [Streptacidiphilus sp. ASG 303]|uniref:serine hydrolase n=1 Tax=Streptacidiphilus sp. ASG 303 TaxID=2896847 RepID=UPI001E5CFFD6|nr:serine hydrolase [Streptacidiphilus sp. ASG 303]MCD0481301.1 class A beta-lactamase-related serine hydrolase [Streptacidiphilus sp. ASG 303]